MTSDNNFDDNFDDLDEFDLDDLDLLDDEFDDQADPFDDDEGETSGFEDDANASAPPPLKAKAKPAKNTLSSTDGNAERTFLQKYFYFIVGGIVALFILLFLLGTGGGGDTTQPVALDEQTQTGGNNTAGAATAQRETDDEIDVLLSESISSDNSDLLPMPNPIDSMQGTDIPMLIDDTPMNDSMAKQQQRMQKTADTIAFDELPTPDNPNVLNLEVNDEIDSMMNAPGMNLELKNKRASQTQNIDLMAQQENITNVAAQADITEIEQDINQVKNQVETVNADLSNKISATNEKIDRLLMAISALENKLDGQKQTTSAPQPETPKATVQTNKQPTPKTETIAKTNTNAVKEQPVQRKATPKKTIRRAAPRWELRSAQPGKAVVVTKGGNNFKTIEVGNTLSGIGRIQSIKMVNGKWVVQGTQGRITH